MGMLKFVLTWDSYIGIFRVKGICISRIGSIYFWGMESTLIDIVRFWSNRVKLLWISKLITKWSNKTIIVHSWCYLLNSLYLLLYRILNSHILIKWFIICRIIIPLSYWPIWTILLLIELLWMGNISISIKSVIFILNMIIKLIFSQVYEVS